MYTGAIEGKRNFLALILFFLTHSSKQAQQPVQHQMWFIILFGFGLGFFGLFHGGFVVLLFIEIFLKN